MAQWPNTFIVDESMKAASRGAATCGQIACRGSCSQLGPLQEWLLAAIQHARDSCPRAWLPPIGAAPIGRPPVGIGSARPFAGVPPEGNSAYPWGQSPVVLRRVGGGGRHWKSVERA
ncbi:hypothetical protein BHM03_00051360 [Ensete ventricosum]|nr:hypothetical protein BHM03_00051360 [Ensete ventricosum]